MALLAPPPGYAYGISKAPVGVLGNAEEIIRHASLRTLESFSSRYFLFTPPTQDVLAYVMTGRIIAVYIHRMLVGFNPTLCPLFVCIVITQQSPCKQFVLCEVSK